MSDYRHDDFLQQDQFMRDEIADRRARRDAEREPRTPMDRHRDLSGRRAVAVRLVDTSIIDLDCPLCRGPVFAVSDSDGERIDCNNETCGARLVTRLALGGEVSLEVVATHKEPG